MSMQRRTVLKIGGAATLAAVAGCLTAPGQREPPGNDTGSGDEKDAVPVLTGYTVSDHTVRPTVEHYSDMDAWGLFLDSPSTAEDSFSDSEGGDAEDVWAFIESTDFEAGDRLLYVEAYGPQTCYELILADDPEIGSNGLPTVRTTVNRTKPAGQPCGDAVSPVDILLRLSFDIENGPLPNVTEVIVSGYKDEPEELLIDIEQ